MLVTAEAPGIHKTEGHSVGTPAETALGRVELWKNVGSNASIDKVLKNFEDARESSEVGSPSRLMTGTTRLDFQADGPTERRRTRLKKGSRR